MGEISLRVGIGRDFHRLSDGRALVLCGVTVAESGGCVAHSDGDCAVHALADALLGAAALPAIGRMFPDTDETNRGRNSIGMLGEVIELLAQNHLSVINVDMVIQIERPRLDAFLGKMQNNLAKALGTKAGNIGIKATSAENTGPIGRGEAMEVLCVCLLRLLPEENNG
ncbi:MAG: 2-C-methyl-D-erythritol 2,4-cyclodiphosphate synthase [Puniceicoccales bacterium]|nr:2-C-methyl-D-erythritol 2,4-cyclodiphosphate synthase [Puniceicoccales bacterium]